MLNLDWKNEDDYIFTKELDGNSWAWEFLKRNTDYQQDYGLWKKYGNECLRGKAKYLDEQEESFQKKYQNYCETDKSIIEEDNKNIKFYTPIQYLYKKYNIKLICLYSNPPIISDLPDPNIKINTLKIFFVDEIRINYLYYLEEMPDFFIKGLKPKEHKEIALLFNLELPISYQLKEAKKLLMYRRNLLREKGKINVINKRSCKEKYMLYLRIFDAKTKNIIDAEIAKHLFPDICNTYPDYNGNIMVRDCFSAANKLVKHNYKYIPLILNK